MGTETEIAELLRETEMSAAAVAAKCHVSVDAAVRWMRRGRMAGGRKVRLAGYKAGRGWMTTEQALARFLAACSSGAGAHIPLSQFETRDAQAARAKFKKALKRLKDGTRAAGVMRGSG